jgi:hypothetical protein
VDAAQQAAVDRAIETLNDNDSQAYVYDLLIDDSTVATSIDDEDLLLDEIEASLM